MPLEWGLIYGALYAGAYTMRNMLFSKVQNEGNSVNRVDNNKVSGFKCRNIKLQAWTISYQ